MGLLKRRSASGDAPGAAVARGLALALISGLIIVTPLAGTRSDPSAVVVTIPPGAGVGAFAAPGYNPSSVTVVIGVNNTVTWINNDTFGGVGTFHTVTPRSQPAGGKWPAAGSGAFGANASYSFTFTVPGTYTYYCIFHSWMKGTVIVRPATAPVPEFPTDALAILLFAVIAASTLAAAGLRHPQAARRYDGAQDDDSAGEP